MERGETKENQTLTPRKFRIQTLNVKLGEFLEFVSSSVTIRFCTISLKRRNVSWIDPAANAI